MVTLIRAHEDPVLFREAVNFTAADDTLVFKRGTCLAKVHADFSRLSEDLDFVISTPVDATRTERRTLTSRLKERPLKSLGDQEMRKCVLRIRGEPRGFQRPHRRMRPPGRCPR